MNILNKLLRIIIRDKRGLNWFQTVINRTSTTLYDFNSNTSVIVTESGIWLTGSRAFLANTSGRLINGYSSGSNDTAANT